MGVSQPDGAPMPGTRLCDVTGVCWLLLRSDRSCQEDEGCGPAMIQGAVTALEEGGSRVLPCELQTGLDATGRFEPDSGSEHASEPCCPPVRDAPTIPRPERSVPGMPAQPHPGQSGARSALQTRLPAWELPFWRLATRRSSCPGAPGGQDGAASSRPVAACIPPDARALPFARRC